MPKPRPKKNALPKTIENSREIVYLLGSDFTVWFANQACCDWIGLTQEQILGTKCVYTSQNMGEETDSQLAGLCPPPDVLTSILPSVSDSADTSEPTPTFSSVQFKISSKPSQQLGSTELRWRDATASRLTIAEDEHAILVVGGKVDQPLNIDNQDPESSSDELHNSIAQIRQQSQLAHRLDTLVGTSPFAIRLRRQVNSAIDCSADLLIVGPNGSGREHLARTIHAVRNQKNDSGSILTLDCAIADQQQVHSVIGEALARRKSKRPFSKEPVPDSLLLLNVDQLVLAAQTELLGFLQLPELRLEVFATSSQSLVEMANNDEILNDLSLQLGAMTIQLPPLAERAEDIPMLAQSILESENVARKNRAIEQVDGHQFSGFDRPTTQLLLEYAWPGNLNQLKQVIAQATEVAKSEIITSADLPKKFHDSVKAQRIGSLVETEIQMDEYLQSVEKELLERAFQQARGNKTKAAKLLGINRAKLLRRLQHFEIGEFAVDESQIIESSAFEEID